MKFKEKIITQQLITRNIHNFFLKNGFYPMNNPKIVPFIDDELEHLIKVKILGRDNEKLFLSRSPQLYKEIAALESINSKVYEVGPVFRGELVCNNRRANEFLGLDVEIRTNSLEDVIEILSKFVLDIQHDDILINYIKSINNNIIKVPNQIVPITYSEALKRLKSKRIDSKEEKELSRIIRKEEQNENIWVLLTEFPVDERGFYQINSNKISNCFDLIADWEICSGGLRRIDINEYSKFLESIGWTTDTFKEYFKIKSEYKNINTGGFGIGIERLTGSLLGNINIAEIQPYLRIPGVEITF